MTTGRDRPRLFTVIAPSKGRFLKFELLNSRPINGEALDLFFHRGIKPCPFIRLDIEPTQVIAMNGRAGFEIDLLRYRSIWIGQCIGALD